MSKTYLVVFTLWIVLAVAVCSQNLQETPKRDTTPAKSAKLRATDLTSVTSTSNGTTTHSWLITIQNGEGNSYQVRAEGKLEFILDEWSKTGIHHIAVPVTKP